MMKTQERSKPSLLAPSQAVCGARDQAILFIRLVTAYTLLSWVVVIFHVGIFVLYLKLHAMSKVFLSHAVCSTLILWVHIRIMCVLCSSHIVDKQREATLPLLRILVQHICHQVYFILNECFTKNELLNFTFVLIEPSSFQTCMMLFFSSNIDIFKESAYIWHFTVTTSSSTKKLLKGSSYKTFIF